MSSNSKVRDYKVRDEYYRAAKKHITVCKKLVESLLVIKEKENNNSSLNNSELLLKEHILTNLYYLSGYIIECTYCMVIFHHFHKLPHKKALIAEQGGIGKKNISFSSKVNDNPETCIIANSHHRLGGLKRAFEQDYLNREVPINLSVFRECQILFDEWEAEVRYCKAETEPIKSHLTIKKVEAFFNGASEIFNACKSFHPESKSSKI